MAEEGEELVADLEGEIADAVAKYPELAGKSRDVPDPRRHRPTSARSASTPPTTPARAFFEDLGLTTPESVADASAKTDAVLPDPAAPSRSTRFDDVDIIVTYGDDELVDALEGRPAAVADAGGRERRDRAACPAQPAGHRREPDAAVDLLGARRLRRPARRGRATRSTVTHDRRSRPATPVVAPAPAAGVVRRPRRLRAVWLALVAVVLVAAGRLSVAVGSREVAWSDILAGARRVDRRPSGEAAVAKRIPRTLLAVLVGAALGGRRRASCRASPATRWPTPASSASTWAPRSRSSPASPASG